MGTQFGDAAQHRQLVGLRHLQRGAAIGELRGGKGGADRLFAAIRHPDLDGQRQVGAGTQLADAAQFANVIITTRSGKPVRLGDVAKVIDSVENTQTRSTYDGTPAIVLAVQRQPDANTVEVVDRVKAMIPAFEDQLPAAASLSLLNDRSTSIRQAVEDVQFTLLLTIALVVDFNRSSSR